MTVRDLPPFDPRTDRRAAVVSVLDDVWQFFHEISPPPGMTRRELRNALQSAIAAGVVVSSRDGVYNQTRYATTALGDQWQHGGDLDEWITVPHVEARK